MYEQETPMLIPIDLLIRLEIATCKYKSIYCDILSTNRVNSLTILIQFSGKYKLYHLI